MFHSSSRHHFDTMFVILCVIAGATAHSISNSSRTSHSHKLHDRHRPSFINLLLDENLAELVKQPETLKNDFNVSESRDHLQVSAFLTPEGKERENQDVCAQLSSVFNGNQIRYCHKHYDILESILPKIIQLTKQECSRITKDLRWNCATIDLFLDRSNALSFTKEAALIRSILNASMMYLIVKTCSDGMHRSCGCQSDQDYLGVTSTSSRSRQNHMAESNANIVSSLDTNNPIDHMALNRQELRRLETGSALRLTRSMIRRQGCTHNTAFADALTGVFMDADDVRSLNKAYKILNEDSINNRNGFTVDKRVVDADYKDLSFIKWAKSAINLHNNQIGRQVVREAKIKQCKCHGISGMCQFQTCWDQLHDFKIITTKLREIYLNNAMLVEVKNLGSFAHPDLYLTRSSTIAQSISCSTTTNADLIDGYNRLTTLNRVQPDDLTYLYESPNYCDAQPTSGHLGTRGRQCFSKKASDSTNANDLERKGTFSNISQANKSALGTCEYLCCDRGFHSELVLDIVKCNCGFRFCCKVECDHCLRQQVLHYCR
uniref:Protein Wnt n=1 Tax=Aceria tosichella TaxID=561515 RepID=A0A6G1SC12_9ACAR